MRILPSPTEAGIVTDFERAIIARVCEFLVKDSVPPGIVEFVGILAQKPFRFCSLVQGDVHTPVLLVSVDGFDGPKYRRPIIML
jgi:hypothetical protein